MAHAENAKDAEKSFIKKGFSRFGFSVRTPRSLRTGAAAEPAGAALEECEGLNVKSMAHAENAKDAEKSLIKKGFSRFGFSLRTPRSQREKSLFSCRSGDSQ